MILNFQLKRKNECLEFMILFAIGGFKTFLMIIQLGGQRRKMKLFCLRMLIARIIPETHFQYLEVISTNV